MSSDTQQRISDGSGEWFDPEHVPVSLVTYISATDGVTVVEVETGPTTGRLRVYVNDGPVFDQDPEQHGPHGECGYMFQDEAGECHRCDVVGTHQTHWCMCGVAR